MTVLDTRSRSAALAGLLDVREQRRVAQPLEVRENKANGTIVVEGYAATFDSYEVNGGPASGGWVEQLATRCFDETLAEAPDVMLLINHEGLPIARTKSGNLTLRTDRHGLRIRAELDASDPDVARLAPKMKPRPGARPMLDEMSFAFRVKDQSWDASYSHRTINRLSIDHGDVSIVNYGMNPGTQAVMSADAVGVLASLSAADLAELRKLDRNQVRRAAAALSAVASVGHPAGTVSVPAARADTSKPFGDVKYADPGYKADGKKRYPIDTADHVRAAWSYINMPKNQKGYSSAQVSSIKGRIKSRASELGVKISEGDAKSLTPKPALSHIDTLVRTDGNTDLVAVMRDGSRVPLPSIRDTPVARGDGFQGATYEWQPLGVSEDPHDEDYDESMMGALGTGPTPENIEGDDGEFDGTPEGDCHPDTEAPDHHDDPYDEEKLSMDHHDDPYDFGPYPGGSKITPMAGTPTGDDHHGDPYDLGAQVGNVPNDRPNVGGFPQGPVAENIVTTGGGRGPGTNVGTGGAGNPVGTAPVDAPGHQAYDWTSGTIGEPGNPEPELDGSRGMVEPGAGPHGHDEGDHDEEDSRGDDWTPTNIHGGDGGGHNAGQGNDMDSPHGEQIDLCMAEALDSTICRIFEACSGNAEARKLLAVARRQLNTLVGVRPAAKAPSDVSRKLAELRKEAGAPDTGSVADGLAFLRSAGSAPVGYRGVLSGDPDCHLVTAEERIKRDAAARRAREATAEAEHAEARYRAIERERELNDVIERHRRRASV